MTTGTVHGRSKIFFFFPHLYVARFVVLYLEVQEWIMLSFL